MLGRARTPCRNVCVLIVSWPTIQNTGGLVTPSVQESCGVSHQIRQLAARVALRNHTLAPDLCERFVLKHVETEACGHMILEAESLPRLYSTGLDGRQVMDRRKRLGFPTIWHLNRIRHGFTVVVHRQMKNQFS